MNERARLFDAKAEECSTGGDRSLRAGAVERRRFASIASRAAIGLVAVGSLYAVVAPSSESPVEPIEDTAYNQQYSEAAERHERLERLEAYDTARADRLREIEQARTEKRNDPHQNTDEVVVLPEEPAIQQHEDAFVEAGAEFGVNPNYLATIAWIETCGNPDSGDSSAGAEGMMQVMPSSAEWATDTYEISQYDPSDPTDSIRVGAAVLALHMTDFASKDYVPEGAVDNFEVQFALYNGGPGQAAPFVLNEYDRSAVVDETEAFLYEGDYILNERPKDGDETRCNGDPVIERAQSTQ